VTSPPSPREAAETLARNRFVVISVMRFAGVALVMLGFAIMGGVIDLPRVVGAVFVIVGVADVFIMPLVLVRRWKAGDKRRP
jgi:membrane protein YdbS with pleckstrin-like domain